MGFQRLPHAINTSCRSQSRHTSALIIFSASSVNRQQPPQHQPINFGIKWFSSTTSSDHKPETTKGESKPLFPQQNFSSYVADGPVDSGGYVTPDTRFFESKPTIAYAKSMPHNFCAMRHEQIVQLSVEGDFGARREALIRNVMAVDSIEHEVADGRVTEMWKFNQRVMRIHNLPYELGLGAAVTGALVSFPLVFDLDTVKWFNDIFVTCNVPETDNLETWWEVSIWSWKWMDPICGEISLFLLLMQFARVQMKNLGIKPFGNVMKGIRSKRLKKKYPQYNSLFIKWFSEGDTLYGSKK